MKKNKKNDPVKTELKRATPITIKVISFFVISGSAIAILFYLYLFVFNVDILNEEISLALNPFLSLKNYILLEILIFSLLIIGAVLMLYLNRKGLFIMAAGVVSLLTINGIYFDKVDWFNIIVAVIILLILIFNWKKIK